MRTVKLGSSAFLSFLLATGCNYILGLEEGQEPPGGNGGGGGSGAGGTTSTDTGDGGDGGDGGCAGTECFPAIPLAEGGDNPSGIVVSEKRVFWIDEAGNVRRISAEPSAGELAITLFTQVGLTDIAVDDLVGDNIYGLARNSSEGPVWGPASASDESQTNIPPVTAAGPTTSLIAAGDGAVYWYEIAESSIFGSTGSFEITSGDAGGTRALVSDIENDMLFWTYSYGLGRTTIASGSGPDVVTKELDDDPGPVRSVDKDFVYWQAGTKILKIARAWDSGDDPELVVTTSLVITDLAAVDGSVYWLEDDVLMGRIGTETKTIYDAHSVTSLDVDKDYIYFTVGGTPGEVMKIAR